MPNEKIQPEFMAASREMDAAIWIIAPQDWGVATANKTMYIYILKKPQQSFILIENFPARVKSCQLMRDNKAIKFKQDKKVIAINLNEVTLDDMDTIIKVEIK